MSMQWRIIVMALLGCAFLIEVVASKSINETDKMLPVISAGEQNLEVTNGSVSLSLLAGSNATFYCNASVRLVCNASGDPLPSISWLFNGHTVDEELEMLGVLVENDSLVLKDVARLAGVYMCIANSTNGTVNVTSFIRYIDKMLPVISAGEQNLEVTNGSVSLSLLAGSNATFYCNASVRLVCNASGDPLLSISWLFNGHTVDEELEMLGVLVENDSLVLKDVARLAGVYMCIANSTNGTVNVTSFIRYIEPRAPEIHSDFKTEIITENHDNTSITVGTNATVYGQAFVILICNASGPPYPDIYWNREGHEISTEKIDYNKLTLPHDPALSGTYSCEARNLMGNAKLSSVITFIEPIRPTILRSKEKIFAINGENHIIVKIGDDVTTIAGTAFDMECLASGIPKPDITWYHNGNICQTPHQNSVNEEGCSHNKAVFPDAGGNYTCVAKNAFGNASVTSYIHVIEPVMPYINSSNEDIVSYNMTHPLGKRIGGSIKSLVGVSIWLECPMDGIPRPEIQWEKDNLPISPGKRIKVFKKRLEVFGTIMSDNGLYSCIASNGAGTVSKATFVELVAPEKPRIKRVKRRRQYIVDILPTPLSVQVGINLRILAHREVTIHCTATGFPTPVLSWLKSGRPIMKKDNVLVGESGEKLVFKNFVPSQNGVYSCKASNVAGQDLARTLILGRKPWVPRVEIRKAILSKYQPSPQKNVEVYEIPQRQPILVKGSDVILECVARQGYPRAHFRWFKNGRPFYGRITESFNRSKLKLINMRKSDEGSYRCFASNIVGQHEKTVELHLQRRSNFRKY